MIAVAPMVFVVDDDPSVRKSLTRLLTSASYAVEAFASAGEFLARERYAGPCCLVLDVRMPGLTGLDLQEALASSRRRMPIVFITGHGDVPMSVKAMKGGALDFLSKPVDDKDLLAAIERCVAKDVQDLSDEARVTEVRQRIKMLTPRETEVFALVVTGMLNKQIASELGIGEKTVKVHRAPGSWRKCGRDRSSSWCSWLTERAGGGRGWAACLETIRRQLTLDQRPIGRPNAVHYILGVADGSSPVPGEEAWEDIGSLRRVSTPRK